MTRNSEVKVYPWDLVRDNVTRYICGIGYGLDKNMNTSNAKLAELRRGVGKVPGEIPKAYGVIFREMPECFIGSNGTPKYEENAVYAAITLYAFAQQGWSMSMNTTEKVDIGKALAMLAYSENDSNSVKRYSNRLNSICSARSFENLSTLLRSIVSLLRNKGMPINYGILARDLYFFQCDNCKINVIRRWQQSFAAEVNK